MDEAYVAVHLEEDRHHWWFQGRLRVLLAALRAALPRRRLRLLELGCGSGNVMRALGEFGDVVGMEPDERLIAAARADGLDVRRGTTRPPRWRRRGGRSPPEGRSSSPFRPSPGSGALTIARSAIGGATAPGSSAESSSARGLP